MLRRLGLGLSIVAPAMQLVVEKGLVLSADRTFDCDNHQQSSVDPHRPGPNVRSNELVTETVKCQSVIAARAAHEQTTIPAFGRIRPLQQV